MNRLQVGDECYVRNGAGDLRKAIVTNTYPCLVVFVRNLKIMQRVAVKSSYYTESQYSWRLVYPFPCVKDLAI